MPDSVYQRRLQNVVNNKPMKWGELLLKTGLPFNQILVPPLERTKDTAGIVAKIIGVSLKDIHTDARPAEYDMGDLSGKPVHGVAPLERVSAPHAENPVVFQKRVTAAIEAASRLPGNTLIVSHAGVGRIIEATRQGIDPQHFYEVKGYMNAQVAKLTVGGH